MTEPTVDQLVIFEPTVEDQTDNPPAPVEEAEEYTIYEPVDLALLAAQLGEALNGERVDVSLSGPADSSRDVAQDNPATLYVEADVPRRIVEETLASYKPVERKTVTFEDVKAKAARSEPLTTEDIQVALRGLLA